jgi:hypothetical protein
MTIFLTIFSAAPSSRFGPVRDPNSTVTWRPISHAIGVPAGISQSTIPAVTLMTARDEGPVSQRAVMPGSP